MRLPPTIRPFVVAIVAYCLAFQAVAVGVARAEIAVRHLDPAAAFDAMAALCAPGDDKGRQHERPADAHMHGSCCILVTAGILTPPIPVVAEVLAVRDAQLLTFHPARHVWALATAPPPLPESRGPPISA